MAATVMAREAEDFDEDLYQPSSPKPVLVRMVLQSQHHSSPVCYGDLLEDAVDGNDFREQPKAFLKAFLEDITVFVAQVWKI